MKKSNEQKANNIKSDNINEKKSLKEKALFGLSAFPDQLTYQAFTILVFTFYFTIVINDIMLVWFAFIIWAIWNMFNDPLLGALSERTRQKGKLGKRRFFLIIAVIPLSLIMIFLFTVPLQAPLGVKFAYFMIIILTFELVYSLFDVNVNAVFQEVFPNVEERASANLFIKGFTVIAVILATLIPTIIITQMAPTEKDPSLKTLQNFQAQYVMAGIVLAILVIIPAIIFLLFGVKEKEEIAEMFELRPSFSESLKITWKNKTFLKFTFANMCIWYCFGVLLTIFPLYCIYVLGIEKGAILIGISLMLALVIAALSVPIHKKIGEKIGNRNGLMLALIIWIGVLFPFVLLSNTEEMRTIVIFVTALQGFPLGGALFYVDLLIGDVIDEDELKTGVKRSASYYGVNAFIHRFSAILSITTIMFVFTGSGWSNYNEREGVNVQLAIKIVIFVFPAIALSTAILFLKLFDLHGVKLEE
ncbi:MAG: MFS transporter, partial [Promethearchaeota archaeon]